MAELSKDQLKDILRAVQMHKANIENWKYVETNAEYLDKKQVTDALTQILALTEPIIIGLQDIFEIEALTRLDPIDLV